MQPIDDERTELLNQAVLSVSGWRLCFAPEPESEAPSISPVQRDFVAAATATFAEFLSSVTTERPLVVAVGMDTRPTGPAVADTAIRTFLSFGIHVRWAGPVASPEIMAYTGNTPDIHGFFYLTASHNPPGYNGFKFGLHEGSVLSGDQARPLIEQFRRNFHDSPFIEKVVDGLSSVPVQELNDLQEMQPRVREASSREYRRFVLRIAAGTTEAKETDMFLSRLRTGLSEKPIGIVGELNGSARCTSIDRTLLPYLGVRCAFHNDQPGRFAHQILPEGPGLEAAARLLKESNRHDPAFQIAYVPDNDGDRGNLVFIDDAGHPVILEAQDVFALTVMIELAWLRIRNPDADRIAIVANDATSIRVDEIARWFGAAVFRAEVGEANVVDLGKEKTRDGWIVPILGEGSNGGSIVPPSSVRDPLNTVLALLKLQAFSLDTVIRDARRASGSPETDTTAPGSRDSTGEPRRTSLLLNTVHLIPRFTTTNTDDPRAKMQIGTTSAATLKERYEELLHRRAGEILPHLEEALRVTDWELWNYEGTRAFPGPGNRSGAETGGLRAVFLDRERRPRASVWMRGSGTEPVFRVLADCAGSDHSLADRLIQWHRDMVRDATRDPSR